MCCSFSQPKRKFHMPCTCATCKPARDRLKVHANALQHQPSCTHCLAAFDSHNNRKPVQILFWKKRAEEELQRSGLEYTIVRPGEQACRNCQKLSFLYMTENHYVTHETSLLHALCASLSSTCLAFSQATAQTIQLQDHTLYT